MSYVIASVSTDNIHCVSADKNNNCFTLAHVRFRADLKHALCFPTKTEAMEVLNWINKNDIFPDKSFHVQPEARYQK